MRRAVSRVSLSSRAQARDARHARPDARPFQITTMDIDYVCVKAAMFSFSRLRGADPITGVEMASTQRRWPAWAPTSTRPTSTRWKGVA